MRVDGGAKSFTWMTSCAVGALRPIFLRNQLIMPLLRFHRFSTLVERLSVRLYLQQGPPAPASDRT
jgi:hypothetical protein